ncbi:MAG: Pectate lyase [Spirosoma sp.]|nr:Pectate lyase [Spirosoma sp.]
MKHLFLIALLFAAPAVQAQNWRYPSTAVSLDAALSTQPASYTGTVPFDNYYTDLGTVSFSANRLTLAGTTGLASSTVISKNTVGAKPGGSALLRVLATGITPDISAFKLTSGSQGFVSTSGITNVLSFFYDGLSYWVSIFQEASATALDLIAPTLSSAVVTDALRTRISLTFSEPLDATAGLSAADFSVPGKTVSTMALSGSVITVDVTSPFTYSDVITVSGGAGKIRDASLNIAANLSSQAVTSQITNLILSTATVADASRSSVILTFNKAVNTAALPAVGAFSLSQGNTVTAISASASSVTLTSSSAFNLGDVITVTYTQPGSNKLSDLYGSQWASGTYAVTNNIVAPLLTSALVTDALRTRIVITANKPVTLGSTSAADFTVPSKTVSAVSVSGSTVNVDVSAAFAYGDVPTVSYTSGTGKLQDQYGSLFASATNLAVTNNIQTWQPITWSTSSLSVASGIWSPTTNIGTTSFGQTGILSSKKLAAGTDGGLRQTYNSTTGVWSILGLKTTAVAGGYATFLFGVYANTTGQVVRVESGATTTISAVTVSAGELLQLYRTGSTVKVQKVGTDGTTVTDLWTFTTTNATDLYPAVDVRGDGKNNTPMTYNVN